MAESESKSSTDTSKSTSKSSTSSSGGGGASSGSYAAASRLQAGESLGSGVTTRVPRGVGEPPSDAVADEAGVAATQNAVRETVEAETEQGFRGDPTDPTPNRAYTVAGVTGGDETPETRVFTPRGNR